MSETPKHTEHDQAETQYDRYAAKFRELFESSQAQSRDAMESAMEKAREYFVAVGEMSHEQGELFKAYLARDLDQTARDMRELGEEAKERLHPSRVGAGALAATAAALKLAGNALLGLASRSDQALHYRAGEMTSAGTLTCVKCGKAHLLTQTTRIAPCTACSGTDFRKTY